MKLLFFPFFAGMNPREARNYFVSQCRSLYDEHELEEIFNRIAEDLTSKTTLAIKLDPHLDLDEHRLNEIITELKSGKPIQYVLGYEWFYDLKIEVNEHVLIPRPETEELVRWIQTTINTEQRNEATILDIGTGSGCIAIALKTKCPKAQLFALDISTAALQVAQNNARNHSMEIQFLEGDILIPEYTLDCMFDIIVSNPPYITHEEKEEMEDRVVHFEPEQALFVSNQDPLQFYKAIADFSLKHLKDNGYLYFEVNSTYGAATQVMLNEKGYETELRNDIYGNVRMLQAQKRKTY